MPTKTTRRRKPDESAAADDVTFTEFDDDAIDFDDDSQVEEKPKKKATRKKATKKTAAKKTTAKKATKKKATKKAAAKKTTARKMTRRKATEEDDAFGDDSFESANGDAAEDAAADAKPARKTRTTRARRTKRDTADDTTSDSLDEIAFEEPADEAPKKKPATRRRSRKTTEDEMEAATLDAPRIDDDETGFGDDEDDTTTSKRAGKSTRSSRPSKRTTRSRRSREDDDTVDDRDDEIDFTDDDDEAPARGSRSRRSRSRSDEKPTRSRSRRRTFGDDEKGDDELDAAEAAADRHEETESSSRDDDAPRSRRGRRGRGRRDDSRKEENSGDDRDSRPSRSTEARSDDDGDQPRRRRRRRGRRGKGGDTDTRQPQQSNKRGRRGRGSRNGGGNQPRGHQMPVVTGDYSDASGPCAGVLELHPIKGYGFLREKENDFAAQEADPFVSTQLIERYELREGVYITGELGPGHRNQGPRLKEIETIEGMPADDFRDVKPFDKLTPVNPTEQIKLEVGPSPITMRVMDLLAPIGKGQRALIVAPPRSGKTILLQQIADSVAHNHPECHLMVLLIDERPEEVTEMRRHVKGDVIASSMDRDLENHVRVSQLVIERAKRLAERGEDVFILLDSITRTARAFNKYTNTGRTGSGGMDVRAMDVPKKLFGTARLFDEGGSVTVVGTALVETGSRMDDVIFQEFKGTGNMELQLSRDLADRRIFPAIDISRTGTRREELLLSEDALDGINMMRRSLLSLHPVEAMETLIKALSKYPTNDEFLSKVRAVL